MVCDAYLRRQFIAPITHIATSALHNVVSCSSYGGSRRPRPSIMKIDNLSELDTTARVHTILASVPNIYTYSCTTQYDDTMHTT